MTEVITEVGISSSVGARFLIDNLRFEDANGDPMSRPRDIGESQNCASAGGTHFFPESMTIDGTDYDRGCYFAADCTADLPLVLGLLDSVSEWACENPTILKNAFFVAGGVAVVAGAIIVAPSAAVAAAALQGAIRSGFALGVSSIVIRLGPSATGIAWILNQPGVIETLGLVPKVGSTLWDAWFRSFEAYEVNGEVVTTGDTPLDLAKSNVSASTYVANRGTTPSEQDRVDQVITDGLAACMVKMTDEIADEVVADHAPTHDEQEGVFIRIGTDWHHLCEYIPIYVPSVGSHRNGTPIREATVHISQTVFNTPGIPTTSYPNSGHPAINPTLPQEDWFYLHRDDTPNKPDRFWYQQPATYNCKGNSQLDKSDCDEWPAFQLDRLTPWSFDRSSKI